MNSPRAIVLLFILFLATNSLAVNRIHSLFQRGHLPIGDTCSATIPCSEGICCGDATAVEGTCLTTCTDPQVEIKATISKESIPPVPDFETVKLGEVCTLKKTCPSGSLCCKKPSETDAICVKKAKGTCPPGSEPLVQVSPKPTVSASTELECKAESHCGSYTAPICCIADDKDTTGECFKGVCSSHATKKKSKLGWSNSRSIWYLMEVLTQLKAKTFEFKTFVARGIEDDKWDHSATAAILLDFFTDTSVAIETRAAVFQLGRTASLGKSAGFMQLHNDIVEHLISTANKPKTREYHQFLVDLADTELKVLFPQFFGSISNEADYITYLKESTEVGSYAMFDEMSLSVVNKFPVLALHPHYFGLFMVYPQKAFPNFFYSRLQTATSVCTKCVQLIGGTGHARNIYFRVNTGDAKQVTSAVKGVGLDCTLIDYKSEYTFGRHLPISKMCKAVKEKGYLPFMYGTDVGNLKEHKHYGYEKASDAQAEMQNFANKAEAAVLFNTKDGKSKLDDAFAKTFAVLSMSGVISKGTLEPGLAGKVETEQYTLSQMSYFSEGESILRAPMAALSAPNLCSRYPKNDFNPFTGDIYRMKVYTTSTECETSLSSLTFGEYELATISDTSPCLKPEWGVKYFYKNPKKSEFGPWDIGTFHLNKELEEWDSSISRLTIDFPTQITSISDTTKQKRAKIAYALIRNLLLSVGVFIKDADSSGLAGNSFASRNYGVAVRDADEWGKGIIRGGSAVSTTPVCDLQLGSLFYSDLKDAIDAVGQIMAGLGIECASSGEDTGVYKDLVKFADSVIFVLKGGQNAFQNPARSSMGLFTGPVSTIAPYTPNSGEKLSPEEELLNSVITPARTKHASALSALNPFLGKAIKDLDATQTICSNKQTATAENVMPKLRPLLSEHNPKFASYLGEVFNGLIEKVLAPLPMGKEISDMWKLAKVEEPLVKKKSDGDSIAQ